MDLTALLEYLSILLECIDFFTATFSPALICDPLSENLTSLHNSNFIFAIEIHVVIYTH